MGSLLGSAGHVFAKQFSPALGVLSIVAPQSPLFSEHRRAEKYLNLTQISVFSRGFCQGNHRQTVSGE